MDNTTVWNVYEKVIEKRNSAIKGIFAIPLSTIAEELKIEANLAEECAIALDLLDVVQFDKDKKEISLP